MEPRGYTPDTDPESRPEHAAEPFKPGKEKRRRKGSPGNHDTAVPPEGRQSPERSEDFGRRHDIETADEPAEEHDRRHHDQDAEVGRPV